jgi:hypothetical protein
MAWGPHHPIDVLSFNRAPDEDVYITEVGCARDRVGGAAGGPRRGGLALVR